MSQKSCTFATAKVLAYEEVYFYFVGADDGECAGTGVCYLR